tara:strand:+ start:1985 stop:3847 length:1863 start_codon:yes stop_codon:yes gene_type:complete
MAQDIPSSRLVPDWCRLDAPGLYRELRAEARAAAIRDVAACPTGGVPQDMPKHLVVPLPCGRALDMVRVDIPALGVLDHFASSFGGAPSDASILTLYAQGGRAEVLSGTFSLRSDDAGGGPSLGYEGLKYRSYYMASHEWTVLQQSLVDTGALRIWAANTEDRDTNAAEEACRAVDAIANNPDRPGVMPAANISWYDAQATLGVLNDYLMAESKRRIDAQLRPLVPWEQGSSGFFRLPSEIEWEYAAIGGARGAVDRVDRHLVRSEEGTISTPELSAIAVLSTGRTDNHLSAVGTLLPNLVGLYDSVGNVSELTHDLFSLVRPDGRHGGRGGVVLRGGNSLTPEAVIGIGHRLEMPLHTVEGAGRSPFGGMRLMLAAPMLSRGYDPSGQRAPDLPNVDLAETMAEEHELLVAIRKTPGAEFRDQAQRLLSALQDDSTRGSALDLDRVAAVRRALEQSEASINTAQEAELAANIRSAADAIFAMRSLSALAIVWHERLDEAEIRVAQEFPATEKPAAEARIRKARDEVLARTGIIEVQVRDIYRGVEKLARADNDRINRLLESERIRLKESGIELYEEFLIWDKLSQAISRARRNPGEEQISWMLNEFDVFREERAAKWER